MKIVGWLLFLVWVKAGTVAWQFVEYFPGTTAMAECREAGFTKLGLTPAALPLEDGAVGGMVKGAKGWICAPVREKDLDKLQ